MTPTLPNPWLSPVTEKLQDKIARAETPVSEAIVPTFTLQYLLRRPTPGDGLEIRARGMESRPAREAKLKG